MHEATARGGHVGGSSEGVFPVDEEGNTLFLEPCRIISSFYRRFSLRPHLYYCRSFFLSPSQRQQPQPQQHHQRKKRKRRTKLSSPHAPNPKELLAQQRHLEIRKFILDSHTSFLKLSMVSSLLKGIEELVSAGARDECCHVSCQMREGHGTEMVDFVKLGAVWQAPLYTISLSEGQSMNKDQSIDFLSTMPLFKQIVDNDGDEELIGTCAGITVILPKKSQFLMSDFADLHQLLPHHKGNGYNLILIDPPWENKSVHRHGMYATLPNNYLLRLPVQEMAHPQGALLGLWVTNRERLRAFVEEKLFPAWGAIMSATWFWLKVHALAKAPDKRVIISIPGDHSRKPPVGVLLSTYVPGYNPVHGVELFAREMSPGWTSWGNEPLHFQQMHYFGNK